jgi:IPT/TIG domain
MAHMPIGGIRMKRISTLLLLAAAAFTMACGYSQKATTPTVAGTMPAITQLAPDDTSSGGAAFTLTVNGSNFSSTAKVNWNGTPLSTTVISTNQVMATVSAEEVANPATVSVTVINPATAGTGAYGSGGTLAETSSPMNFTVN